MTLKLKRLFLMTCLLGLFTSCDDDNDNGNNGGVTPPEKDVTVNIDLLAADSENIIYIYSTTELKYTANNASEEEITYKFSVDDSPISSVENIATLKPAEYDEQIHTLKLKMQPDSRNGSLAKILKGETYSTERQYKLKYVKSHNNLEIKQRVSEEGYLEVYWDKPIVQGATISRYDVYHYVNNKEVLFTTLTADQVSFIDKDYVYGIKVYKVVTHFESEQVKPWENLYTVEFEVFTYKHCEFTTNSDGDLQISWRNPNPFRCKSILRQGASLIHNAGEGPTVAVYPRFNFPIDFIVPFQIHLLPVGADDREYLQYPYHLVTFGEKNIKDSNEYSVVDQAGKLLITYNGTEKGDNNLNYYDLTDNMKRIKTVSLENDAYYISKIKLLSNSPHAAVIYRSKADHKPHKIVVYSDKYLTTELSSFITNDFSDFELTSNNGIIIQNEYRNEFKIFDRTTGELITSKNEIIGSTKYRFKISGSADGKYIFTNISEFRNSYRLYEFDGKAVNLVKENISTYGFEELTFNPINSNEAIGINRGYDPSFSIISMPSMEVLKTVSGTYYPGEGNPFDAITGNIFYKDTKHSSNRLIHILDNKTYETMCTFKSEYMRSPKLINNYMFDSRGYYMKIEDK